MRTVLSYLNFDIFTHNMGTIRFHGAVGRMARDGVREECSAGVSLEKRQGATEGHGSTGQTAGAWLEHGDRTSTWRGMCS